jgi:hypothetical protein
MTWPWWQLVRWAKPVGRAEVRCRACGGLFWLLPTELVAWRYCPACLGWWTFTGRG